MMPDSKFIFMVKSKNDTPSDLEKDESLLVGSVRLFTVSLELVQWFELQGWWEGTPELYEKLTGLKAFDIDGDGDEDEDDMKLADKMYEEKKSQNESHAKDTEEGRIA